MSTTCLLKVLVLYTKRIPTGIPLSGVNDKRRGELMKESTHLTQLFKDGNLAEIYNFL